MTHIWQGVQASRRLTAAWPVRPACPSARFASPAMCAFTLPRAAKDRAGSAAAAVEKVAQA